VATLVEKAQPVPKATVATGGWSRAATPGRWWRLGNWLRHDLASLFAILILAVVLAMALVPSLFTQLDPEQQHLRLRRESPSLAHPLGMDELGRDIFSRIVYGARYTLGAGLVAVGIGLIVGVPMGLIAGMKGGGADAVLMRTIDALLSFPYFLIAVMLAAALGPGLVSAVLAVGMTMVPSFARVVRGSVLSMKHSEYVLSAEALGCSSGRLLRFHILPNVMAPLIVLGTLNMASGVLAVAGLGFLGLGLQPPTPEWGVMLNNAKTALTVAPHVMIFPGLALVLLVTACNLLGDGLRELLDPRLRQE
jgi:peptide/nickel transport system permease protein